ncbi:MAG TPA: tripartite tricarboxylate transporter substrate-binding protein, partial [Burkholderiaceae bacterium]|nr:tripartite tricarboxylate transporter substrate-binding protein [Burkholderiaceae bacterium]
MKPGLALSIFNGGPITIVVAYPSGGDVDAMARTYAEKLAGRLGRPVIVDNRPGASGTIGSAAVARAKPDGTTLLLAPSTFAIAQQVLKVGPNIAHDVVRDFTPIIKTGSIPLLLVTAQSSGIKDLRQLVTLARSGKPLTYGTPGAGSPMHIAGELFNSAAGIRIIHVPYRGLAPLLNEVLGGHVSVGWMTTGAAAEHVASGRLVPLAVAERKRTKLLPQVPTFAELRYHEVEVTAWMGLLGPKGMQADAASALNRDFDDILRLPDVQAKMSAMGIE